MSASVASSAGAWRHGSRSPARQTGTTCTCACATPYPSTAIPACGAARELINPRHVRARHDQQMADRDGADVKEGEMFGVAVHDVCWRTAGDDLAENARGFCHCTHIVRCLRPGIRSRVPAPGFLPRTPFLALRLAHAAVRHTPNLRVEHPTDRRAEPLKGRPCHRRLAIGHEAAAHARRWRGPRRGQHDDGRRLRGLRLDDGGFDRQRGVARDCPRPRLQPPRA